MRYVLFLAGSLLAAALCAPLVRGGDDAAALQKQIANLQSRIDKLKAASLDYPSAAQHAAKIGKPLATFVGCNSRPIEGFVVCEATAIAGRSEPRIIVSVPANGWLAGTDTVAATASDGEIRAATAPRQVQALPAPFVLGKAADGNIPPTVVGEVCDALAAVNATRAQRGLRAYLRDDGLTAGALRIAAHRAERRMYGHTANDFNFLEGCTATVGGCAGATPDWGWLACATYENWTYCGAAWVLGSDGRLYCHAFYR